MPRSTRQDKERMRTREAKLACSRGAARRGARQVVRPLDPVAEALLGFESDAELVAMIDAVYRVPLFPPHTQVVHCEECQRPGVP